MGTKRKTKTSFKNATSKFRIRRRIRVFSLRAKGFSGDGARMWARKVERNARADNGYSKSEKKLAYSWGFLPNTVSALSITDDNRSTIISERDYLYLHPMNGKYDKWIHDRITARNVFKKFSPLFEQSHFHIFRRTGELFILPLSGAAKSFSSDIVGLHDFLISHTSIFVTSTSWSNDRSWELGASYNKEGERVFLINGIDVSEEAFTRWVTRCIRKFPLVVSEHLLGTPFFAQMAPEAHSTLKVRILNSDGLNPHVAQGLIQVSCYKDFRVENNEGEADADLSNDEHDDDVLETLGLSERELCVAKQATSNDDLILEGIADDTLTAPSDEDVVGDAEGEALETQGGSFYDDAHDEGDGIDVEHDLNELTEEEKAHQRQHRLFIMNPRGKRRRRYKLYSEIDVTTGSFSGLVHDLDGELTPLETLPGAEIAFEGIIPYWNEIKERLAELCLSVPQIEFAEFKLDVSEDSFKIISVSSLPRYSRIIPFAPEINDFFLAKSVRKRKINEGSKAHDTKLWHNLSLKIRRMFAEVVAPRGLVPYQSTKWIKDIFQDLFSHNGLPVRKKIWAYRHGFLSYRLDQYGITPENWESLISDFEYRWIRHINTKYKYWLEDKITLKYVADQHKNCFPGYYYYTSLKNGQNQIIPLMDLPQGYGADHESILRLAKEKGILALKPDEGSHGDGFYRLEWIDNDHFELNGKSANEEEIYAIISNPSNQYIITEYIQVHNELKKIYPNAVNTIRITVFKKDGRTPEIGNAYMRIGTSKTGFVDNLAAGGLCAEVDIETGRYGNTCYLDGINQGNIVPIAFHPDTNVKLEGTLPNWEYVKESVLAIAEDIAQLEYFGFDVAITENGIKIPEINRFPDFPRIDKIEAKLNEYLLYKLGRKKRLYGYDLKPCNKIISLPKRSRELPQ